MPLVAPFAGERFVARDRLSDLIAPPYDVISPQERAALARQDAYNIVHLILPEGNGDRYERAGELLRQWRAEGVLSLDEDESVYVVQQQFRIPGGKLLTRTGVIGAVAVEAFPNGRVKPHEKTHAGPKADRLELMRTTEAMFEALLMLARDEDAELKRRLHQVVGDPVQVQHAELAGVQVKLWRVSGPDGAAIAEAAGAGPVYLADGHHRYETAIAYMQENVSARRTLGLVVPVGDPGLALMPTHRLIYSDALDVEAVVEGLRSRFHIRELPSDVSYTEQLGELRDRGTACIIVRPGGNALALLLKGGANLGDVPFADEPTVASLDVHRVDELVVRRLLGSGGERARLGYSAESDWVIDEVLGGDAVAGVLLNPVSLEQVLAVADAGAVMPQKATYFMPKVPSGLVMMGLGG